MRVDLLGPVRLRLNGAPVDLGTPQQRCVFAVLAMTPGNVVLVDTLIDRVWGDRPPRHVRAALYTYVSRLRALLPTSQAAISRRDGGYALDVDPAAVDLHRARRLAGQGNDALAQGHHSTAADMLARACRLWTSTPLAGAGGPWADHTRVSLEYEHLSLLGSRFDAALRAGRHTTIISPLAEALVTFPLAESLVEVLMRALHRDGRTMDAMTVYHQFRRRLSDALGAAPGPRVRHLHDQLMRTHRAAGRPAYAPPGN